MLNTFSISATGSVFNQWPNIFLLTRQRHGLCGYKLVKFVSRDKPLNRQPIKSQT